MNTPSRLSVEYVAEAQRRIRRRKRIALLKDILGWAALTGLLWLGWAWCYGPLQYVPPGPCKGC